MLSYDGVATRRPRDRSGVREPRVEDARLPRARRGGQAGRGARQQYLDARYRRCSRPRPAGRRTSSACISSARRNIMRLLEVVRGGQTGAEVLATALALAKRLGKVPVVVANCRGLRRQPHDVPLHVRGAVPGRGRGDAGAGGSGADRVRHGDGHLRRGRHGRDRRRVAGAAGARTLPGPGGAAAARGRQAVRARAVRTEDGPRLVPV